MLDCSSRYTVYEMWIVYFSVLLFVLKVEGCDRSLEVRGVEDYCWTRNVEVVDRLEHTGKHILNFAKKTLGMEVETDNEPQKCDYYHCIFQELKLINGDGYPCYERTTTWIKNNIPYNHAAILLSRADICTGGLAKSITSNKYFTADTIGEASTSKESQSVPQSKCEIVAEYMKCMAHAEKKEECPVFQYP